MLTQSDDGTRAVRDPLPPPRVSPWDGFRSYAETAAAAGDHAYIRLDLPPLDNRHAHQRAAQIRRGAGGWGPPGARKWQAAVRPHPDGPGWGVWARIRPTQEN